MLSGINAHIFSANECIQLLFYPQFLGITQLQELSGLKKQPYEQSKLRWGILAFTIFSKYTLYP